jgi:DNA primase
VALGEADGRLVKNAYRGKPEDVDEEYSMRLQRFQRVSPPLTAAEIKKITGFNYVFMSTMFGLDADSGKAVRKFIHDSGRTLGSTP